MGLDVLLEILGALERLAAEVTLVRLQGHVHADMRCDVVALDSGGTASIPLAREIEVVGALATNMLLTDVFLNSSVSTDSYSYIKVSPPQSMPTTKKVDHEIW